MHIVVLDDWNRGFADSPHLPRLQALGEVTIYTDQSPGKAETIRRLQPADIAIFIRERSTIDREILENLPNLKFIAQTGGGAAHMDHEARQERGIDIAYTPGASHSSVIEMLFGLMIATAREIPHIDSLMHQGEYPLRKGRRLMALRNKRLSIIGFGSVGTKIVAPARAFEMEILAYGREGSRKRAEEAGVDFTDDLGLAFERGDFVSINVALRPETRGLVKAEHLDRLRPGSVLINTGRGAIIEEQALIDRLSRGDITAAFDVYHKEPLPPDHPLRSMDNVILSPHASFITDDCFDKFLLGCVQNIEDYLRKPDHP